MQIVLLPWTKFEMNTNHVYLHGVRVTHSTSGINIFSCVNITTINTTVTHVSKGITFFFFFSMKIYAIEQWIYT